MTDFVSGYLIIGITLNCACNFLMVALLFAIAVVSSKQAEKKMTPGGK